MSVAERSGNRANGPSPRGHDHEKACPNCVEAPDIVVGKPNGFVCDIGGLLLRLVSGRAAREKWTGGVARLP
jgi:hypothetical protein